MPARPAGREALELGQLLIIRDEDAGRASEWLTRGTALFERLCGLRPVAELRQGPVALAGFPWHVKPSPGVVRGADGAGWAAGAGTWLRGRVGGEPVLRALLEELPRGAGALARFVSGVDGSFALAAGGGDGAVEIATDPVGTLHVYRRRIGDATLISTSSLVLAALAPVRWEPDSVAEFLATGTVFERRTLFREIHKLGPGCVYRLDGTDAEPARHWDPAGAFRGEAAVEGTVEALGQALRSALDRCVAAHPRPVMDLTGGLDSRALLAAALAAGLDLDTVVNGPDGHPDVVAAARIAGELGLRHRHQAPTTDWPERWWSRALEALPLVDGEYDVLEYARTLDNHRRLADAFDASVNGSGGEFAKGYWWELLLPFVGRRRPIDDRRLAAARFATDSWTDGLLAAGPEGPGLVDHFAAVIRRANRGLEELRNTAQFDNVYLTLRMQRWQGRIASATGRLWPCLSPFMFREPMEVAFSAPPRIRVRNRMSRRLIERLEPRLARLPLAGGLPAAPLRPTTAHRYLPLARELAGKLWRRVAGEGHGPAPHATGPPGPLSALLRREELRELLDPRRMRSPPLYADEERLVALVDDARRGAAGRESHLGRVITLELLARKVGSRA